MNKILGNPRSDSIDCAECYCLFPVPILNISVELDIAESLIEILMCSSSGCLCKEGSTWAGFEADGLKFRLYMENMEHLACLCIP